MIHLAIFMGTTVAQVRILGPTREESLEKELLVDTGSLYSWIPRQELIALGIVPKERVKFRLMVGESEEREIGEGLIEYNGRSATTIFVFGEEGDGQVLGVYALEGLRLEVDPLSETLRESEATLAL